MVRVQGIILLLLTALAKGQSLTLNDPAMLGTITSTSLTTPGTLGARYWWRFEDAGTTNSAVVSWLDVIKSLPLTNSNSSLRPTNSSTGVGFDGTTWLTNTSPFLIDCGAPGCTDSSHSTNGSLWILVAPQSTGLSGLVTSRDGGGRGVFTVATRQFEWFSAGGNVTFNTSFTAGTVIDLGLSITNAVCSFYTNGVLSKSVTASDTAEQQNVGSYGTAGGTSPFVGKVLDVAYFTNYLKNVDYTSLHPYAVARGANP